MKHPMRLIPICLLPLLFSACMTTMAPIEAPRPMIAAAPATNPYPLMGDWKGMITSTSEKKKFKQNPYICARVIGLGDNEYEIQLIPDVHKRAAPFLVTTAKIVKGTLKFKSGAWSGIITANKGFTGKYNAGKEQARFSLKKVHYISPTLGQKPPKDAIILFDGKDTDRWQLQKTKGPVTWKIVGDAMEVFPKKQNKNKGGSIETKQKFGSCKLHIEFKLPYEPKSRGQGRGNSGVFLACGIEVQILDSYGLLGAWNECGALYKTSPPKINMCAPPEHWQSYDITYIVPEFDHSGKVTKDGSITVSHNGKLIHNKQAINVPTANTQLAQEKMLARPPGPISLQDHGNKVQYRNIWLIKLD